MARTNNKDVYRGVVLYLDGKQVAANATQIRAEMKKVKGEIDKMTVGSEEYIRATKRYRELDAVLQQHKAKLRAVEVQQQSMLSKGVKFFKEYSLQITGAITALTGVALQLNKFRKQAAEQEDAAANLKALTGLNDDNIAWLTEQAEKLSTTMDATGLRVRKSAKEILEAYMLVGSAKPELLSDKEALNAVTIEAMRLAEAANMELNEAVNALTTSLNQYSAGADQAARFTNVLAAGSKFGAANVQDQAAAVVKAGVAASSAGVSFEQLVGVIEMLGEKGIKAEESGTALKRFFLKLQTDADDTNPAIVGLETALDNLAKKNLSMGDLQKMFGDRAINVAKILIDNTEKVKNYTNAVTDTNVAIEQAAINSGTQAAKMAQVRNQINLTGQALAKDLAPIFSKTIGWTRKFVMMLPVIIDYMKKYGWSTATLLTTLAIYNSYTSIATKVTTTWNTVIAFAKTQITGYRASMVAYREALAGSTTAQVAMTNAVKGTNIVTQAGVVVVGLLKAAYYALTLQTAACARTLKMVKVALAESGFGLAVIAIGAAVAAIMRHNEKMKEARRLAEEQRKAERELYKEYDEAAARIRLLRKAAEDNNTSLEERKKAIEELQKLAPDYQASISEEGRLIEKNKEKLDEYLERLKASIVLEAYKAKMTELLQKQMEAEEDQQKASDKYWSTRQQNTLQGYNRNGFVGGVLRLFGLEAEDNARKAVDKADKAVSDINKEIDETEQRMKDLAEKWNFSLVDEEGGSGGSGGTGGSEGGDGGKPEKEAEKQKRIRKAIAAINAKYDAMAAEAKQKYLEGEIASEQDYAQRVQDIELQRLEEQMKVAGLEESKREEIKNKILDIKIKLMQQLKAFDEVELDDEQSKLNKMLKQNEEAYNRRNTIIARALAAGIITEEQYQNQLRQSKEKFDNDNRKSEEKAAEARLKISRKGLDAALLEIRKKRTKEKMTEKQYDELIRKAKIAYYEQALKDQKLSKDQREQLERERDEAFLEIAEETNKKLQEKNKEMYEAMWSLGQEIGQLFGDFLEDSEQKFGDFLKNMLKAMLSSLEKMVLAAVSERTIASVGELGWAGLAKAAAESALITAAFEAAKYGIGQLYTGGYTGSGRWDEPRGIVHAGEFVANRYAVANDAVRPVLDLIDQAQKNGSIANLTAEQIAAVARPSAASTPAAAVSVASASGAPARDPELTAAIRLLTRTTARAAEAYQEPSPAFCFVEGRGSVNEAQALLNKMKSNASRKS